MDETRDADRGAAAALHVTARLVGDGLIEVDPHGARFGRYRGHGLRLALAAARDEGLVQLHLVHRTRPDEERVGRVGGAEIAVAGALHDEAELLLAREVDSRDDIRRVACPDRIDARRRRPGVEPAGNLRARGLIADIEGVMEVGEDLAACRAIALLAAGVEERLHPGEIPPDRVVELLPARRRRPGRIAGAHARKVHARPLRGADSWSPGRGFLRRDAASRQGWQREQRQGRRTPEQFSAIHAPPFSPPP